MRKRIILASGGLDSFLLWALHGNREGQAPAQNLFVRIGHKYEHNEYMTLIELSRQVPGFEFKEIVGQRIGRKELPESGIIPYRNAYLIMTAAIHGVELKPVGEDMEILLGVVANEINSDKSDEFFKQMSDMLDITTTAQYWNYQKGWKHKIYSPIRHLTKSQLVWQYLQKGLPDKYLYMTRSCYADTGKHCGECPSCFKKWVAFRNNNLPVDKVFAKDPEWWAFKNGIIDKCYNGTYTEQRAQEIIDALTN